MPKTLEAKTQYTCDSCGASFPKWGGQCPSCGAWNTLVEGVAVPVSKKAGQKRPLYGLDAEQYIDAGAILAREDVSEGRRLSTGIGELDRVFGGGIVFGSVTLVGGQPGIGKSTLLTQSLIQMLNSSKELSILYSAGEESPTQIAQRIQRLNQASAHAVSSTANMLSRFHLSGLSDVDVLVALVEEKRPKILVVDSIQTLYTQDLTGIAGSVGQLRECASRLVALAKRTNIPILLVGHVTKDGDIAGPKVLEHIVDTVLEINGDRSGEVRIVRSLKNRFGPTDEVGLFRLSGEGMTEVRNPAEIFLEESTVGQPGSALALCLEGSRPVVAEVQALVVASYLPSPRRVSRGISVSKLHVLLAVLERHAKVSLSSSDVYVSVVGNMEFKDPAIDAAVAAAIISAKSGKSLEANRVYCGEIGLLGELRRVVGFEKRAKEAKRLGYSKIISAENTRSVRLLTGGKSYPHSESQTTVYDLPGGEE